MTASLVGHRCFRIPLSLSHTHTHTHTHIHTNREREVSRKEEKQSLDFETKDNFNYSALNFSGVNNAELNFEGMSLLAKRLIKCPSHLLCAFHSSKDYVVPFNFLKHGNKLYKLDHFEHAPLTEDNKFKQPLKAVSTLKYICIFKTLRLLVG